MKTNLLLCLVLWAGISYGQSLEQHVIGSAGGFATTSGSTTLSWTLGEVITTTESSASAILTQGFQQPVVVNPMTTNELNGDAFSIHVFPNPTSEQITVQKEQDGPLQADLIDILGRVIDTYPLQNHQTQIDLDQLPAANYLLRIRTIDNEPLQTFKIQKIQ